MLNRFVHNRNILFPLCFYSLIRSRSTSDRFSSLVGFSVTKFTFPEAKIYIICEKWFTLQNFLLEIYLLKIHHSIAWTKRSNFIKSQWNLKKLRNLYERVDVKQYNLYAYIHILHICTIHRNGAEICNTLGAVVIALQTKDVRDAQCGSADGAAEAARQIIWTPILESHR